MVIQLLEFEYDGRKKSEVPALSVYPKMKPKPRCLACRLNMVEDFNETILDWLVKVVKTSKYKPETEDVSSDEASDSSEGHDTVDTAKTS